MHTLLVAYYGGRPLKSTWRQGDFLSLTGDMEPTDMQQEVKKDSDRGHGHFLKLTCDMGIKSDDMRHGYY